MRIGREVEKLIVIVDERRRWQVVVYVAFVVEGRIGRRGNWRRRQSHLVQQRFELKRNQRVSFLQRIVVFVVVIVHQMVHGRRRNLIVIIVGVVLTHKRRR